MIYAGYALVIAVVVVLLYLLAIKPAGSSRISDIKNEVRYYAHRGLYDNGSNAPENSMRAFEKAVKAGYGIEMDVRLTKDHVPVVCHDNNLKRLCGQEIRIEDLKYEELQAYRILGTDQGIPKFEEVLALTDGKVPLIIEYKVEDTDASVCIHAERILKNYKGTYCIESFHPFVLLWYKHNRPEILRGILSTDYSRTPRNKRTIFHYLSRHLLFNFFTKPDFIAYDCKAAKAMSRNICRKLYHSCLVAWTVKSREDLKNYCQEYDWFIFEGYQP